MRVRSRGRRHLWDPFWRHAILDRDHVNLFHGEKPAQRVPLCIDLQLSLTVLTLLFGISRFFSVAKLATGVLCSCVGVAVGVSSAAEPVQLARAYLPSAKTGASRNNKHVRIMTM